MVVTLPSSCFIGDLQKIRWYFSSTALQGFQATAFANGGPLPPGYGVDPTNVYLDVEEPNANAVSATYSYPGTINKEATGIYYYSLDTTPAGGKWWWRAYGTGAHQGSVEDYILVSQNLPGPAE